MNQQCKARASSQALFIIQLAIPQQMDRHQCNDTIYQSLKMFLIVILGITKNRMLLCPEIYQQTFSSPRTMAYDLAQLQSLIDTAQTAEQFKKDVQRALKKVSNSLSALQTSVDEANELLSGDYQPATKERKPRTPRALATDSSDDTPKKRGRKPKTQAE